MQQKNLSRLLPVLLCAACMLGLSGTAHAAGIPFSVIGPHEYTLPLNFEPIPEFVQSIEVNGNGSRFNANGSTAEGPGGDTITSSTKLAYLFQIHGLKRVGFEAEVIEPAIRVTNGPSTITGLGDPVAGLVV